MSSVLFFLENKNHLSDLHHGSFRKKTNGNKKFTLKMNFEGSYEINIGPQMCNTCEKPLMFASNFKEQKWSFYHRDFVDIPGKPYANCTSCGFVTHIHCGGLIKSTFYCLHCFQKDLEPCLCSECVGDTIETWFVKRRDEQDAKELAQKGLCMKGAKK
jgi:hypothetical protein